MCDRLQSEQNTQNLSWLGFSCCLIDYQLQFASALFMSMHSDLSIFVNCFALNITRKIFKKCHSAVRCKLNLCVLSKTCMPLITRRFLPLTESFQMTTFTEEKENMQQFCKTMLILTKFSPETFKLFKIMLIIVSDPDQSFTALVCLNI